LYSALTEDGCKDCGTARLHLPPFTSHKQRGLACLPAAAAAAVAGHRGDGYTCPTPPCTRVPINAPGGQWGLHLYSALTEDGCKDCGTGPSDG
jgi:hypothetical protein